MGEEIRHALRLLCPSLREIADALGVSHDTAKGWSAGRTSPSPENRAALAGFADERARKLWELATELRGGTPSVGASWNDPEPIRVSWGTMGFYFAFRALQEAFGIEDASADETLRVLREIASGKLTVFDPAFFVSQQAAPSEDVRSLAFGASSDVQRFERAIAASILSNLGR